MLSSEHANQIPTAAPSRLPFWDIDGDNTADNKKNSAIAKYCPYSDTKGFTGKRVVLAKFSTLFYLHCSILLLANKNVHVKRDNGN